jgi:serine protease Do
VSVAKRIARTCSAMAIASAATHALAVPPDQIYERVAPAVWSVKSYSGEERLLASASGVVIAPGKLVTSCQVLARAHQVSLRQGHTIFDARLEFPDVERDLCQLDVPGMTATAVPRGSARGLRVGQRLYVVGYARSNQQSLGEGLVSAVLDPGTGKDRIQTTIPASPGLLGAGLFDEEGRLVGVVTSSPKDAAASAFAVPADWLAEVPARGSAALAARIAAPAPAAADARPGARGGLPVAGASWTYGYLEKIYSRRQIEVKVRVLRVDGSVVEEAVTAKGSSAPESRRVIDATGSKFFVYPFSSNYSLTELSPYLLAASQDKIPAQIDNPQGYPLGSPGLPTWVTSATVQGWEQVAVPAGTYRALRVGVAGRRGVDAAIQGALVKRFSMTIWYAPDVRRIVRMQHRQWAPAGYGERLIADEIVELLAYRPPG